MCKSKKECSNCDAKKDVPKGSYCRKYRSYNYAVSGCISVGNENWSSLVCEINGEEVRFGIHKVVKARKEHTCLWCKEAIEKGENYVYVSMLYEGEFQVEKSHEDCEKAKNAHYNEMYKQFGPEFDTDPGPFKRGTAEKKVEA